jgi:hypothetical protein
MEDQDHAQVLSMLSALLDLSRLCTKKRITADGIVFKGPAYVFDVHFAAGAGGAATAILYNGTSTNEDAAINLATIASTSFNYWWYPPIYFPKGCYIDVGDNVTAITFHFLEKRP